MPRPRVPYMGCGGPIRWLVILALATVFGGAARGQPATGLTESDRQALAEVADRDAVLGQGPGFFALASLACETAELDRAPQPPPKTPDWASLRNAPAAARGAWFGVQGELLRVQPYRAARAGPWGHALVECLIRVGPGDEGLVFVYLAQPAGIGFAGQAGDRVACDALFYKVYREPNAQGASVDYPVFVAGGAVVASASAQTTGKTGLPRAGQVAGAAALALAGAWFARRFAKRSTGGGRRGLRLRSRKRDEASPEGATGEDAPTSSADPVEALAELRDRND
ncbi:MAG: hypothetical protein AAF612_07820 [Planctomycetota bacterium]